MIVIEITLYVRGFICLIAPIIKFTEKAYFNLQGQHGSSSNRQYEISTYGLAKHKSWWKWIAFVVMFYGSFKYCDIENLQINVNGGNGGREEMGRMDVIT
jgi:hypothetical protein